MPAKSGRKPRKENSHCHVAGCGTMQPHLSDLSVASMMKAYEDPKQLAGWAEAGMKELALSFLQDMEAGRVFAWVTRLRQIEELYIRAIYTLLIAEKSEVPHLLSNMRPNGFSALYKKVNDLVFEGRGKLTDVAPGRSYGEFTPMETINQGAHVSFASMLTAIGINSLPNEETNFDNYHKHLETYLVRLNYMRKMFEQGRSRDQVLEGLRMMHKPDSYWIEQQRLAKGGPASEGSSSVPGA
jgi:hypothetical protein